MKLNRRGFFKRSAVVGAAIAVSPLLIGGKDGGTGPGTAVTAKDVPPVDPNPGRVTPAELANAALFEAAESGGHRYSGRRAVLYMGGYAAWPPASPELIGQRRERAQNQPRDERGRFVRC